MYRILYNESTIFDPYGNENEVVTDASMSVEINAAAYLDFTMSRLHPLYNTIAERDGVVTLYWDQKILFQGVIESIDMDIQGNKSISCVSALDYLNDTVVRPYSTIAGEQELTAPSSVDGYFQWLIDQHNDHVLDAGKLFEVGVNQGANLQQNNFIYRSSTNNPTTASEITDQLLDSLGGYLTMRYVDDRRVLDLYADIHTMNAQIIDFGVNITDFSKTIDTKDQYTALLLKGGSPEFLGGDFENGDFEYWVSHPNTPIATSTVHGGTYSSFFTEGNGEYINSSFFYARKGARYKSTVWIKNERSSSIKAYPRYQVYEGSDWVGKTIDGSYDVPNDGEWHEYSFDFMPNLEDYVKIRPRWVFDTVGNDGNKRVYVDDFDFRKVEGDTDVTEDPISVAMVPDGGMQYDANILKTGDVIYDPTAVARYGYKEKVYEDSTITDVDDLLQAGVKELNKLKDPQIGLDIKAVDLALFMDGYDHLNVGDAVRVRSAIHDTDEFLMVTSITLDLQDPGQSEYNIGKAYDSLTGQQSGFLRSLNSGINSSLDAVASLDQTTKDQAIQLGNVENVANQAQNTANNAQNTANQAVDLAGDAHDIAQEVKDAQTEYEKQLAAMQQGVADAEEEIGQINDRIDGMNTEIEAAQSDIEAVRTEAQSNFETAKSAVDAAASKADAAQADVDALRSSTSTELQNVKDSVSDVQSDVADALQQASDLAEDLDATKTVVEQTVTEFGEVKTTASNAATKADQSLKVSTEASQTATQASQTATSAYEDAQQAITQSSQAVQTANQVSLNLSTNYQTKADADAKYATQASLTATSSQIKAEVSETYATKATVEGLENIANNAVQTWMGSGAPTLSNKPASDWNTTELKAQHSGDIYYDSDTGYSYRFGSSDGSNYSWALIKDTDISKAIADAAAAQETADEAKSGVTELNTSIPITYATKTELTQTSDSITSRVEEVAQAGTTTSNKVSQLEQTASGLQSTVKEQSQKLDQQATTISQVSQRVDSVSSTITQVSGRVDDVEDTADEALSQSSQLQQDLSGFKTSVAQQYETKQDALSKQSQLQQTINGFRTEVSEEYTTKDEFNALEIGGTNLLLHTEEFTASSENGGLRGANFPLSDETFHGLAVRSQSNISSMISVCEYHYGDVEYGATYTFSFWAKGDIDQFHCFFHGASGYLGAAKVVNSQGHTGTSGDGNIWFSSPGSEWTRLWVSWTLKTKEQQTTENLVKYALIRTDGATSGSLSICGCKLEKGNKATAWSPAPEDFDGKYTSKTEFAQTTESIKATAQSAASNASSALSKVSSLEVSVDGIDAKVEEVASDVDDAVKTTSQVSQRVDSLTSTITQVQGDVNAALSQSYLTNPDFETGDTTGWDFQGFNKVVVNSASPATGTYKVYTQPDGSNPQYIFNKKKFPVSEGQKYRITLMMNTDTASTHPMNFGLVQGGYTDFGHSVYFTKTPTGIGYSTYETVSGTVTIPSGWKTAQFRFSTQDQSYTTMRLDSFSIVDVTEGSNAQSTANSALSQSSTVKQELTSFKTSVQQTYETKTDALSKQSSLQQSVNNLRTEVSEQYTTKSEFNNLEIGGTNLIEGSGNLKTSNATINGSSGTLAVGSDSTVPSGQYLSRSITGGSSGQFYLNVSAMGNPAAKLIDGETITVSCWMKLKSTSGISDASFTMNWEKLGSVTASYMPKVSTTWTRVWCTGKFNKNAQYGAFVFYPGNTYGQGNTIYVSSPMIERGSKPSAWSPAPEDMLTEDEAAQTYSTKSYVDQTSRTVSLGVVEEYKNGQHGSALATQSDITATKNSITQTVSQTYLSKTDATNTYATKTQLTQTSDSLTVSIKESIEQIEVGGTNIARDTKAFGRNHVSSTEEGYLLSYVNRTNGTYKDLTVRNLISSDGTGVALCEYLVTNVQHSEYYTLSFWAKGSGKLRTYFYGPSGYILAKVVSTSNGQSGGNFGDGNCNLTVSSSWQRYWVVYQTSSSGGTSTDKYMLLRNDNDMSSCDVCGVMIERGNKASDWSASPLDAAAESSAAQSTANTANSNAQNAQNRVGSLETCIKMTSDGVRVGKISNGNFTGYSALVNSAGSFDILDGSSTTVAKFSARGLNVRASSGRSLFMGTDTNGYGYIGSTPTLEGSSAGQGFDIGMTMGFGSGQYLNIINNLGGIGIAGKGISLASTGGKHVQIDAHDVRGTGIILFDRDDNTSYGTINIATGYNFSQFNWILCSFRTNDNTYFAQAAYHPNGKNVLFGQMGVGGDSDQWLDAASAYYKVALWNFNGTQAVRKTTKEIALNNRTPAVSVNDNVLKLVAIIGFDYYSEK